MFAWFCHFYCHHLPIICPVSGRVLNKFIGNNDSFFNKHIAFKLHHSRTCCRWKLLKETLKLISNSFLNFRWPNNTDIVLSTTSCTFSSFYKSHRLELQRSYSYAGEVNLVILKVISRIFILTKNSGKILLFHVKWKKKRIQMKNEKKNWMEFHRCRTQPSNRE